MKEKLIEFETAVLAYDKGLKSRYVVGEGYIRPIAPTTNAYNFDTRKLIMNEGDYFTTGEHDHTRDYTVILAPTQSLLQKWIRETHKIEVLVRKGYGYEWYIDSTPFGDGTYNSYEDALEEGLINGLNLIK